MKIKEIISPKDLGKFRDVKELEVERFLEWFIERERAGIINNKPYKALYDKALDLINNGKNISTNQPEQVEKDPLIEELNKISLQEMIYYVKSTNLNTVQRKIPNLGKLYTFVPTMTKNKREWEVKALELQKILKENAENIINEHKEFHRKISLPDTVDKELGFAKNFKKAISEFIDHIENRIDNKKYNVSQWVSFSKLDTLKLCFLHGKSDKEAATLLQLDSSERCRQIRTEFLQEFMDGTELCTNLRINDDLKQWIKTIKEECVFHSKSFLEKKAGEIKNEDDIKPLNLDLINVIGDIQFVIPKGKKLIYKNLASCIINTIRDKQLYINVPSTTSAIIESMQASSEYQEIDADFDMNFIYNVLSCPEIVDITDDGLVRIKEELLQNSQDRQARLMYELCQERGPITTNELYDEFEKKYKYNYRFSSALSQYGFNPTQKGGNTWHYGWSKQKTLQEAIKEYAERHRIFYYDEIEKCLINEGYTIIDSFRTYITIICFVDTKDNNHFCHKDYCDRYPEFTWRTQARSGLSNWILNQVNNRLESEDEIQLKDVLNHIELQAKDTEFAKDIKVRAAFTIKLYCGEDKPFLLDGETIRRNPDIYEHTDFDTIALRGEKYSLYKRIRAIVANEIEKCDDGKLLLTEAIKLINENLEEPQVRHTIKRAIENKNLPSIGVETCTINGNVYIVKSADNELFHDDSIGEAYTLSNSQDEDIVIDQNQPSISYRLTIDWEQLHTALLRELSSYSSLMENEKIDLDKAIATFINFIRSSDNTNLSSRLPQNLYEFCCARNDRFDRDTYVSNLAIFYEGLLYDILNRKKEQGRKKGLFELALEFPVLVHALSFPLIQLKGFERIFKDLHSKRNKLVHGDSLDLNSADTINCILNFTALYVYTVAKYA